MNHDIKTINAFLRKNKEFSKIRIQGKKLVFSMVGSEFEYNVADFSLASEIRGKLENLEMELKLPKS